MIACLISLIIKVNFDFKINRIDIISSDHQIPSLFTQSMRSGKYLQYFDKILTHDNVRFLKYGNWIEYKVATIWWLDNRYLTLYIKGQSQSKINFFTILLVFHDCFSNGFEDLQAEKPWLKWLLHHMAHGKCFGVR